MKASILLEQLNGLQSQTDLTELENHIFQLFMKVTSASGGSLMAFDGHSWRAVSIQGNQFLLQHGESPLKVHAEGPLHRSFETGEPLFLSEDSTPSPFHPSGYEGYQGCTALIFPLFHYPDHSFKFITLHSPQKSAFSFSDFRLGKHLLQQVHQTLQFYFLKKSALPPASQGTPDFWTLYESFMGNRTFIHNLRNIISPLCLCLPFLNSESQTSPAWKKAFSNVSACVEHLKCLIRSLSPSQGEIRSGELPMPLHLPSLFRSCANLATAGTAVEIHWQSTELSCDDFWCWGFKNEIEQMILNLFKNALEAMPENGRIDLFFETAQARDWKGGRDLFEFEEYACVRIKDNGRGMSEETLKNLFSPGYSTKQDGSGLGLADAHRTLKKHLALVRVESQEGRGSEFCLFFPSLHVLPKERLSNPNPRLRIRL